MATGKRYYWIKLKESFLTSDTIDYFMGQPGGANYVVLYQMLCLKTLNTHGRLERTIGEVVIPFDVDKIVRDTKYFTADTVRIALRLYKAFGLIYEDVDGTLVLTDYDNLVGHETDWKAQKAAQRERKRIGGSGQKVLTDCADNAVDRTVDMSAQDIDIRDRYTGAPISGNSKPISDNGTDILYGNPIEEPNNINNIGERPETDTLEAYAANNLTHVSMNNMQELISFRDSMSDETIEYAIDIACAQGKPFYAYVKAILNRYVVQGIKTVGDAKTADRSAKSKPQAQEEYNDTSNGKNPFARYAEEYERQLTSTHRDRYV